MGTILIILALTVCVAVCTIVIARRSAADDSHYYLDAPVWPGMLAAAKADESTTSTAEHASGIPSLPGGAQLRRSSVAPVTGDGIDNLVDEVVDGLQRIPPLPHVLLNILSELENAGSSARSITAIVSTDAIVTAALLRVANSASCGLRRRIISVDEAVAYLGFSSVRATVLRLKLAELLPQRGGTGGGYDTEQLWLHSLAVGQLASQLAHRASGTRADPWLVSTIGLLHDVGKLAINSLYPKLVSQLWQPARGAPADESFLGRERRLFGADHAFIGAYLAAQWKLPAELVDAIRLHHLPAYDGGAAATATMTPEVRRATQIVHVANQLAKYMHVYCADMEIDIVPESLLEELGLPCQMEELLADPDLRRAVERASALSSCATSTAPTNAPRGASAA